MASTMVGVVRYWVTATPATKWMWMTIIPADDSELNNPVWTTGPFGLPTGPPGPFSFDMVKITQAQYNGYANFAAFQSAILAM